MAQRGRPYQHRPPSHHGSTEFHFSREESSASSRSRGRPFHTRGASAPRGGHYTGEQGSSSSGSTRGGGSNYRGRGRGSSAVPLHTDNTGPHARTDTGRSSPFIRPPYFSGDTGLPQYLQPASDDSRPQSSHNINRPYEPFRGPRDFQNNRGAVARGGRRDGAGGFRNRDENIQDILNSITDASPGEMLGMIGNPRSPLRHFLTHCSSCTNEQLAHLFELFSAVAKDETSPQMSAQFIIELITSRFMKDTMTRFVSVDFPTAHERIPNFPSFLSHLLDVLITCFIRSPALSQQNLLMTVLALEKQLEDLSNKKPELVTANVHQSVARLSDLRQSVGTVEEATQQSRKERRFLQQDAALPPDDYRRLSVFPKQEDIQMDQNDVFLRRNIVRGVYNSVETYLDIHFRLMREDFVEPLRKGVQQYLEVTQRSRDNANNGAVRRRERLDLKVYADVRISSSFPSRDFGVVHDLKFSTERLQRVMWDKTKRLSFGSLVCLSADDFQTMYFGVIVLRDVKDLAQGIVTVKFQENAPPRLQTYVMAESNVFFEAYRHTLTRLQELNAENFPMRETLLGKMLTDIRVPPLPEYIRGDATLSIDLTKLVTKNVLKSRGGEARFRVYPLGKNEWPHHEDLQMDASQYSAFKNALTRNLSIIQGPPGCGKTYVGLKIVQTLLELCSVANLGPILIVCYTNHALDQFLEGMLPFCPNGIVRVGSRCKSEELQKYNIAMLRDKRLGYLDGAARNLFAQMGDLENTIIRHQRCTEKAQKAILSADELQSVIPHRLHTQILQCASQSKKALANWLLGVDDFETNLEYDLQATCCMDLVECLLLQEIFAEAHTIVEEFRFNLDALYEDVVEVVDDFEEQQRDAFDEQRGVSEARKRFKRHGDDMSDVLPEFESESGWCVATSRKSMTNMIRRRLRGDAMSEEQAAAVHDIMILSTEQRWHLYNFWRTQFLANIARLSRGAEREYELLVEQFMEMRQMQDMAVFEKSQIIGMTTTGAARYGRILSRLQPRIVVVEEAAEVLESHIVTSLSRGTQHLILIGDHKQLRPNNAVYRLAKEYNLDVSLFERLIECQYPFDTLALQHRMRPEIAVLMQHIYDGLGNHPCVERYEHVRGMANDVFFLHHNNPESFSEENSSYSNPFEARFVAALCRYLLLNGYKPSQITVLTLYSGQLFTIQRCMPKKDFDGVRVSVVDNFQGEENDIILLSLVRSNNDDKIGFLDRENRICVALSRAKMGLYVVGNLELLSKQNELWNKIVGDMRRLTSCSDVMRLACQMHPKDPAIEVHTAEDFSKAPEGGCLKVCNERLVCGHACRRLCHPMDREHKEYKCQHPCAKMCAKNLHPCKRFCYEDCGNCQQMVSATLPTCGHQQRIRCHQDASEVSCNHPCEKQLAVCHHRCQAVCGRQCTTHCRVKVEVTLPFCGHTVQVDCHLKRSGELWKVACPHPCEIGALPCGHICKGTCGSCANGRLHQSCHEESKRVLVCGHEWTTLCCEENTSTCGKPCLDCCSHNQCPRLCGEPCVACVMQCMNSCPHSHCTKLCSAPCDWTCNKPCEIPFVCSKCKRKVPCVGLCGEQCPKKCRDCDHTELTEIFLGSEDEPEARFLCLPKCGHVVEVTGMDQYIKSLSENEAIQAITCPHCKAPISKRCTKRYVNQVKEAERFRNLAVKSELEKNSVVVPSRLSTDWETFESQALYLLRDILVMGYSTFCKDQRKLVDNPNVSSRVIQRSKSLLDCLKQVSALHKDFTKLEKSTTKLNKSPLFQHFQRSLELLTTYVIAKERRFGPITVAAYEAEMNRLECLLECVNLATYTEGDPGADAALKQEANTLMQATSSESSVINVERKTACLKRLKTIREKVYAPGLNITKQERDAIVAAIGLKRGHWYKCPQGHVYAIADCGGANQSGRCPECGAAIGGQNHRLATGNQLAPEMDGAHHSAFSEENYEANLAAAMRIQAQLNAI